MTTPKHPGGRPTKLTDELKEKARFYIQGDGESPGYTEDSSLIPTVEGLSSYLHIHKDTAYEWAKTDKEFSDVLKEVKQRQAVLLLNNGLSGKYNSNIAKLLLSSKHGYVEKKEVDQNVHGEVNTVSKLSDEELSERIKRLLKKS